MRVSILSLLFISLSFLSFSQNEWNLYKTINGVSIFTKEADCYPSKNMNQTVTLIKISNANNYNITIEWDLELWYNDVANNSNGSAELHQTINLKSLETLKGNCDLENQKLYIYKKFLDFEKAKTTTKFILANIKISKV